MEVVSIRIGLAAAALACCASAAIAQAPSPVSIPLQLLYVPSPSSGPAFPPQWRLGINVGINGGQSQTYLFDTGSSLFNAQYNQSWWPGFTPSSDQSTGNTPVSTVANGSGVQYCYGNGLTGCRGYQGNIVQATTLNFYTPTTSPGGQTLAASLNATPGYQINAVYNSVFQGVPTLVAGTTTPMLENQFYGVFGAGDFTTQLQSYTAGGVLGQTTVSNATQGYVVAANGQTNPVTSTTNPPQQANGQNVMLGGVRQAVTACSPCVTLGLTPQMLGQFAPVGLPGTTNLAGLVPWTNVGTAPAFPNPYGGVTGNNSSTEFGLNFDVTLTAPGGGSTAHTNSGALLDTGTGGLTLSTALQNQPNISNGTSVLPGVTFTTTGLMPDGSSISGLTSSSSVLQAAGTDPITYTALFDQRTPGTTNTIGLSFFLQNSVLFDLSNRAVGYTPFFVTDANLATTASGPLIVDGTNLPLGLAGVISGPGGLTVDSGGIVQLSATNTYSGITRIAAASGSFSAGQLYIAGPGSIATSSSVVNDGVFDISRGWNPVSIQNLTGTGTVYLGAQNLTITNGNGTFSGTIADGGAYNVAGGSLALTGGSLVLSGTSNSYTGGTAVSGGAVLGITADAALGAAASGLTLNGGTLVALADINSSRSIALGAGGGVFNTSGNTLSVSTGIGGTGQLAKTGAGTMVLAGASTYTGGTVVDGGTLRMASGASLAPTGALTILSGTFDLNDNNQTVGALSGTGGTLALGSGTLTVNGSGTSTLASVITGTGGLNILGGGTLYLTGANTFTGGTTISNGRLSINGTYNSNVTIGSNGNLGGNGTITGTVVNGGFLGPGNSIGTLNVVGSFTQSAGGSYQVETNAQGQSDRLNVTGAPGTATIGGGSVYVLPQAGTYAPRTTYTILNATGGVTGTYASVASAMPFLQPSLSYDAQNVYLTLQAGGFAAAAQTRTQAAVGAVLDATAPTATGNYATVVGALTALSAQQGQAAMTAISGQNYAGFSSAGVQSAQMFMSNFAAQAGGGSGGGGSHVALAEACDTTCDAPVFSGWGAWGGAIGGTGTVGANVPVGGLTYNLGGFAVGLDRRVTPNLLLGVTAGYTTGTQWVSGFQGTGNTNTVQVGLYGSFIQGPIYVDGLAGYAYSANQMQRLIAIPGLASMTAVGQTGANQFFGQIESGYRVEIGGAAAAYVTPFARLQGATSTQDAFSESGAGALGLSVAAQTTNSLRSVLGAQLGGAMDLGWRDRLAMQLRLGWSHEYADTGRPVTAAFAGAPAVNFTTYGATPQRNGVLLGLSASTAIADQTSLFLRYEGDFSGPDSAHALTAGVRLTL